jgi:hypothetical protein
VDDTYVKFCVLERILVGEFCGLFFEKQNSIFIEFTNSFFSGHILAFE